MPQPPSLIPVPADTRPREGWSPTVPHQAAGLRVEPPISEASAAAASPGEPEVE
jgi:hypothetical protein